MAASIPLSLGAEDKLDALRYLDEFHFWNSLDDERVCKRCGHSLTGRQIIIVQLKGRRGRFRLQCPTPGCVSSPSEWVYANPVLAAQLRGDFSPFPDKAGMKALTAERTHHGQAITVRRVKRARAKYSAAASRTHRPTISFRGIAARLNLLRPLASGLHSIRPVA